MKKKITVLSLVALITLTVSAQKKLTADPAATKIEWNGKKVVGEHTGTVNLKDGWLSVVNDALAGGEFTIDMSTIANTDLKDQATREKLVGHLKSEDFFGVDKYPQTKLVITGGGKFVNGEATVKGNLTIKDKTNPVEFRVKQLTEGGKTFYSAVVTVDRTLYDIRYGSGKFFAGLGDKAILDEFTLNVRLAVQ